MKMTFHPFLEIIVPPERILKNIQDYHTNPHVVGTTVHAARTFFLLFSY